MENKHSIQSIMIEDHRNLNNLVFNLKEKEKNHQSILEAVENFSAGLEKHFVTEEQAIFTFLHKPDNYTQSVMADLVEQHEEMRSLTKEIIEKVKNKEDYSFEKLLDTIKKHMQIENEVFYPYLDKNLSDSEKGFIIEKIQGRRFVKND